MIDLKLLEYIDPDDYSDWLQVGQALKHEGLSVDVWDNWSQKSAKYRSGECDRKWRSFNGSGITGGTLYHLARQNGYEPEKSRNDYDIHNLLLDEVIVDPAFVSPQRVPPVPNGYDPKGDMLEYFSTLFEDDDFVGYCTDFFLDEKQEWKPSGTQYRRTAGDIIAKLRKGSIESALGKTNDEAGAYVRFNPLDGKGENNANVTRWKYCLIESDTDSIEKQYSLFKEMNLPITFLVNSGGKSLHAITRVDAENAQQYKQRVRELYEFCKKNGLTPDEQDKNESRFSRLPGIKRGSKWQYIVERNIGAESYDAWIEWRENMADDLPADVNMADIWDNLPPLAPELIEGVLREGHKMLLAAPSKSGKSFLLIDLAVSIAAGVEWLGLKCKQGRVCYINLEVDEASCLHRVKDIYEKRGLDLKHLKNLDVWNLRGRSVPMNKLAPILAHRFKDRGYTAVLIDPIYKVITGDENNATEMSEFCSYFDEVATDIGSAVIYVHHHSKGASGKYSNAADRSSGSGVFARDPDAILDMRRLNPEGLEEKYRKAHPDASENLQAYEITSTLREFAPIKPIRCWFDHPLLVPDKDNFLGVASYADSSETGRGTGKGQRSKTDWFTMVGDLLDISSDTAVTLEAVGISESNAKKTFGAKTDYEVATVNGSKVVHRRSEDKITFLDAVYERKNRGAHDEWLPSY